MGCCNARKSDSTELVLYKLDQQSSQFLNNDGVDDLVLTGASTRLHQENLRKSRTKGLSLDKTEESPGQLPLNTPTFGRLGERMESFLFREGGKELKEVTEEQTFGGSPDPSPSLT